MTIGRRPRARMVKSVKGALKKSFGHEPVYADPSTPRPHHEEDKKDVITYGDTIRLQSLSDDGFLIADGYELNGVMWRPSRQSGEQTGSSDRNSTAAAQFTIVCKHTYDKAKLLQKTLNKMGAESLHDIRTKQVEEDLDAQLIQDAYDLQEPLHRENAHNLAEVSRTLGTVVKYGSSIQLRHTSTGKFVTLDTKRCGRETGSLAVVLGKKGSQHSWLTVTPAFRVRKNGDRVSVNDQVKLVFESRSEEERVPVHLRAIPGIDKQNMIAPALDGFEVCGHDGFTRWKISRFAGVIDSKSSSRVRSGMSVRMTHKEEDAYLSFDQMPAGQLEACVISKQLVPSSRSSPRTLWTVLQTNLKSILSLDKQAVSELSDLEVGGDIMWGNLCLIQNLVSGNFLQVVEKKLTTIKFTDPDKVDLRSILFRWVPVDSKQGKQYISLDELFYVEHPHTEQWLHATQDIYASEREHQETATPETFSGTAQEPSATVSKGLECQSRLTLTNSQPDEDAFGVESCALLEVEDYQEVSSMVPMFEEFVTKLKTWRDATDGRDTIYSLDTGAADAAGNDPTQRLDAATMAELGTRLEQKLHDLITGFITTKNLDPNPVTSQGMIHSTRRQDLLREVGLMKLLCEMCKCLAAAKNYLSAFGETFEEQFRRTVLLGNVLLKHLVRDHEENRRYLVENGHIAEFKTLIDADLHVTDLLTEIYKDNDELLRQPNFPQHLDDWVAKLRESICTDGHSANLYLRFLGITCFCNGQAVRPNQVKVLQMLFDTDKRCVMQISEVDGELVVDGFNDSGPQLLQKAFYDESAISKDDEILPPGMDWLSSSELPDPHKPPPASGTGPSPRQPRNAQLESRRRARAMQNYVIESLALFTNLCAGRHEGAVTRLRQLYPRQLISNIVQTERLGCERLRAQAMELFIVMYVDYPPFVDTPTVVYTREWNKVKQHDSTISESMIFEKELDPINDWVLGFFRNNTEQVKGLMGLNKLVLACTRFVRAALRVGYYNTVDELKPQLLVLLKVLDGRTDREVPEEASSEADSSAAITDGWFRPWNQDELEALGTGIKNAPSDCYDPDPNNILNKRGWEWLSERVTKARSGVERTPQMCANRWNERVSGTWRYEKTEETLVVTQTKHVICQILNLVCEVRLNARLTNVLALFIEPLDRIGASVGTNQVQTSNLAVNDTRILAGPEQDDFSTDALLQSVDNPELPLPGQIGDNSQAVHKYDTTRSTREARCEQQEDCWPRILGDEQSRQSEKRWADTNPHYYNMVLKSYPIVSTWKEACRAHTEMRDAMALLRFEDYTGTDHFAGAEHDFMAKIGRGVKDTVEAAERATNIDLDMDGDLGVEQKEKETTNVSFDDILLDLLMYSDRSMTAEAAKLLINVHNERQELAIGLQKVQLLKDPSSIAFAEKVAGEYQKEIKAFLVSSREEEAERNVITVLRKMCAELTDSTMSGQMRLAKQRLFHNLGIDDDVVTMVNTGRFTTEDVANQGGSRWNLYQQAYNFLRVMCLDNDEIKRRLSHYMGTYFIHIEVAGNVPFNAESLVHEIYEGNLQLVQQVTSDQIRFYCRLMSRSDSKSHVKYPNLLARYVKFLTNLICVKDVIVKRNQMHVLNGLKLHQNPLLRLYNRFTWEHGNPSVNMQSGIDMMLSGGSEGESGGMAFHIAIVELLHCCCLGENKAAETLCSQLINHQDAVYIMCHETTLMPVKKAYVLFVNAVYIRTEMVKRNMHTEEWCWAMLNNILADMELFCMKKTYANPNGQTYQEMCSYAIEAVFPFVEYWFQQIVKTTDAKLSPHQELIKVNLFKALRLLGAPPQKYIADGVDWPLRHVGSPAENARAENLNKRCCRAIQSTLTDRQQSDLMRIRLELEDMSMLLPVSQPFLDGTDGSNTLGNAADNIQLSRTTGAVMSEEDVYQRKLSNEFAQDFNRLCSARAPLLYTFLDPDNDIFIEVNETLHEEMVGLAKHLQDLLVHGRSPTSASSHANIHRKSFIQNLANELTQSSCDRDTKIGIIKMLQLTICLTDKRTETGEHIQWPHGERTSVIQELLADELPELSQLQRMFCTHIRDTEDGINLPAIIIQLVASTTMDTELVRQAFNLAIVLLSGGNQKLQEAFLEQLHHGDDEVSCLERMKEILAEGRLEVKESQKHYKREKSIALRNVSHRRDALTALKSVQPRVHLIRPFTLKVCVKQVLYLLQLFCEGGNRRFQQYLSVQVDAQKSVNLVQASLMYMEKWQRCLHPEIMSIGSYVFEAITEFVVGPNRTNQEIVGDAMKLEAINKILGFEVTDRSMMDTEQQSAEHLYKETCKQVIEVKTACVDFLCALVEGAASGDRDRILNKFSQLDTLIMLNHIHTVYKEKALLQAKEDELGLEFGLDLMGDFVPDKVAKTISDSVQRVSERSGLGILKSNETKMDEFERMEHEDALAFSYFALLRQLHDDCEDPKHPKPFIATTLRQWQQHQAETARETKKTPWFAHKQHQLVGFAKGFGSLTKEVKGAIGSVRNLNAKKLAHAGIGTVKSAGAVGLRVSTKAVGSLRQVSKLGIGSLGTVAKIGGLGTVAKGLGGLDNEMDVTLQGALTEYMRQCGRIEILRADSDEAGGTTRRLQRVYFRIPEYCYKLTEVTREDLRWELSSLTPERKLQSFVDAADDCEGEMRWQNKLDQIKLYQILNKRTIDGNGDVKQRIEFWKKITNWLAYMINLLIILGYEHEDKYYSVPEPWTQWQIRAFGTQFDLGSWTMVHSQAHPHSTKVNYVPTIFYNAISLMGLLQVMTCSVVWFIFVLGHGPLVVRKGWKQHYQAEMKAKRQLGENSGPNLARAPGGFKEHYAKLRTQYSLRFMLTSIVFLFRHPLMSYYCGYLLFAVLGIFHSQFWFAFHLLDILQRDQTLQPVIQAMTAPISQIAKTLWLSVIVMYIFTVISFILFHNNFDHGPDIDQNMCNSMAQCLIFTVYSGIIDATMWAEMTVHEMWPGRHYRTDFDKHEQTASIWSIRVLYDIFFFLLIGVLLIGGVLFGIILDKFTELREERRNAAERVNTEDFISGLNREVLDSQGNGFVHHKEKDQNMWHYMYFIIYLQNRPVTKFTGSEAYVWEQLSAQNIGWFPMQQAIVLSHDGYESEKRQSELRTDRRLDAVEQALANVTALSMETLTQLQELKGMLRHGGQTVRANEDVGTGSSSDIGANQEDQ